MIPAGFIFTCLWFLVNFPRYPHYVSPSTSSCWPFLASGGWTGWIVGKRWELRQTEQTKLKQTNSLLVPSGLASTSTSITITHVYTARAQRFTSPSCCFFAELACTKRLPTLQSRLEALEHVAKVLLWRRKASRRCSQISAEEHKHGPRSQLGWNDTELVPRAAPTGVTHSLPWGRSALCAQAWMFHLTCNSPWTPV